MAFSLVREDLDPADAGLVYVCSSEPGWTRRPHGRGFTYLNEVQKSINLLSTDIILWGV